MLTPLITVFQPIPSLAWIPVAILLFGLGFPSTVFVIFMAGVFAIAANVAMGVRNVDQSYLRAAKTLGADDRATFFYVLVPSAVPYILAGLRTALANGWRALIAAEMISGTGSGLGYAIFQARWNLDYKSAFVGIIIIAVIGLLAEYLLLASFENKTVGRWSTAKEDTK